MKNGRATRGWLMLSINSSLTKLQAWSSVNIFYHIFYNSSLKECVHNDGSNKIEWKPHLQFFFQCINKIKITSTHVKLHVTRSIASLPNIFSTWKLHDQDNIPFIHLYMGVFDNQLYTLVVFPRDIISQRVIFGRILFLHVDIKPIIMPRHFIQMSLYNQLLTLIAKSSWVSV